MKIQKFNEASRLRPTKKCICMVTENDTVQYSGIFNTKEDMDNWLINIVNEIILDRHEGEDGDDEPDLVLTMEEAKDWLENDFDVHFDADTTVYNKIRLKYGVDVLIDKNKFNI